MDQQVMTQKGKEDIIYLDDARTLDGLFVKRVQRSPERVAYRSFDKVRKEWVDCSWADMGKAVARWQAAMAREGLKAGDRVALSVRNSVEWVCFEQAALGLGLVVVPLYTDDRPDNVAYILEDAGVKMLLVQDAGRWKRFAPAMEDVESLECILVLGQPEPDLPLDERLRWVETWLPKADEHELIHRHGDPMELATIVYTSGTTGRPKGVMLCHNNILSIIHSGLTMVDVYREDVFLSFLPLSHTLERTGGYYLPMMAGATVAYARSIPQLAEDLMTIKPTILIAVPRIFERVYTRLQTKLNEGSWLSRAMFNAAVSAGWRHFERKQGRAGWHPKCLFWPLLKKLVANKVAERLGGRLRLAVSGGAALPPEIAKVFVGLGIPILQGYGLTETSPVISVNTLEKNDPSSVGVPLRGIEVRIGEDDELLAKSPGVMMGYWNNHQATDQMIEKDGWLHTGDQAKIENGFVYITGRIKDILVLSNGEKVPPGLMEMSIALEPLFEQVMVIGEGESFLSCIIVLNADLWPGAAQDWGVDPMSSESLNNKKVRQAVMHRIGELLHDFPGYAKIRRVHLTLEPWTVDNGLMTPTLKVKRNKVLEHYADVVTGFYK